MVYWQFVKNMLEMFLFLLCLCGIILLGCWFELQNHFNTLVVELTSVTGERAGKNFEIKTANAILHDVNSIQKNYILWTPRIIAIANVLPPHVLLTALSLDATTKTYTFTGTADTRTDLLALQSQVESLPFIDTVTIPISQLTAKDHITFSITASLKTP